MASWTVAHGSNLRNAGVGFDKFSDQVGRQIRCIYFEKMGGGGWPVGRLRMGVTSEKKGLKLTSLVIK